MLRQKNLDKIDSEIRACEEKLRVLGAETAVGEHKVGHLGKFLEDFFSPAKQDELFQHLSALTTSINPNNMTNLSQFPQKKDAFVLALQLRTQAVTLCSIIQNVRATYALIGVSGSSSIDELTTISKNPLSITGPDIRTVVQEFVADLSTGKLDPPPADDTETNRAIRSTLNRQRRVAVRQLVTVLVMAMELEDEKGLA